MIWPRVSGGPTGVHLVMALAVLSASTAPGQSVDEYQVKAAFLYNFAKFVEWAPQAFKSGADPIAICILGQNPFNGALEKAVSGKVVSGRAFTVSQISEVRQASGCQVLFVDGFECKRFRSFPRELRMPGLLTVGDADGFAAEGGVINFKLEDGRVRLEINIAAAEHARLRISSKLLALARIVNK